MWGTLICGLSLSIGLLLLNSWFLLHFPLYLAIRRELGICVLGLGNRRITRTWPSLMFTNELTWDDLIVLTPLFKGIILYSPLKLVELSDG